jgi:uncharacterized protein YjiK
MKESIVLGLLIAVLGSCAPSHTSSGLRYPCAWPGSPGFSGNIDARGIVQPSGICFHPTRRTLFVVSDEGGVFEIRTDGTPVADWRVPGDLEGVTVDPSTGLLYAVVEGEDVILEFDPAAGAVTRRFPVDRAFGGNVNFLEKRMDQYDNGIESLVFVPDGRHPEGGTFYAGNQEDPPVIVELRVPLRSAGAGEAKILRVLPFAMDDPSGLAYNPAAGTLSVISDADNIYAEITMEGKLVRAFAFPGNDQEGFARDSDGYLYIVQDSGGILKLRDLLKRPGL